MCFDALIGPAISAGTGLAGTMLSGSGAAANAKAQAQHDEQVATDNVLAAAASNQVLKKFQQQQVGNMATNQAILQPEYAAIQPGAMEASRQGLAAQGNAAGQGAIDQVLAGGGPQLGLTHTDNGQTEKAVADAIGARTQLSRNDAMNYANLASFGRNMGQLGQTSLNTSEGIDQTNMNARSEAGILPTDEQNAALQARQFIPPADTSSGNTQIGIGNALASNAGGIGTAVGNGIKSLGSLFGGSAINVNPTTGG